MVVVVIVASRLLRETDAEQAPAQTATQIMQMQTQMQITGTTAATTMPMIAPVLRIPVYRTMTLLLGILEAMLR